MTSTITRMAASDVAGAEAVQGWALTGHEAHSGTAPRPVDLLFLHGMAAGGWIWPEAWLQRFTARGYRCWVMTLPGRDGGQTLATDPAALDRALSVVLSTGDLERALAELGRVLPGAALADGPSLGDFTDALEQALARIGRPAVTVGHSLGGAVAQNALRRGGGGAGTVLLNSVPPYGMWRASMQMAMTNPVLWQAMARFALGARPGDDDVLRTNLFPGGIDSHSFGAVAANLRDESLAATLQASGFPPFAPLPGPRRDVAVIGGARDRMIPPLDVMLTGAYYGQVATLLHGAGHMPMHEPAGAAAAAAILDWLDGQAVTAERAA